MSEITGALQAVGHPVRLRLLRRLAGDENASVSELAEAAGVHENTVRAHVAVLEEAGQVGPESSTGSRPKATGSTTTSSGWPNCSPPSSGARACPARSCGRWDGS